MSDDQPPAKARNGTKGTPDGESPAHSLPPVQEEDDAHRPTPVRKVMKLAEPEENADGGPRFIEDPSTGIEWVVRVSGHSCGGILPLRTIPLVHLTFSPPEGTDLPQRRGVFPGEDLSRMEDEDLLAHFQASGPIPPSDTLGGRGLKGMKRRGGRRAPRS
jgi:hypothetical protein